MKKFLILIASLVLVLGLSGCDLLNKEDIEDIIDVLDSVELSGLADESIMVDDVFNVFAKAEAAGSDLVDYTDLITASSDNCTINADGTLDTGIPAVCIIEYSVVALGKLARASITVTIEAETVTVDPNALVVKTWTFDDETALVGWTKYESGGGSVTESVEDGTLRMDIISGGLVYESRFEYMGVPLQNETDYSVSFRAKSSVEGKILHFQMGELLPSDPWFTDFKPGVVIDFVLTEEWADYTFTFTMGIDNVNGGPLFEMGNIEGSEDIDCTILLDDLTISGGSAEDGSAPAITGAEDVTIIVGDVFDPLFGVVANDFVDGVVTEDIVVSGDTVDVDTVGSYTVTYTVSDAAGNERVVNRVVIVTIPNAMVWDPTDLVVNGEFNAGVWGTWMADWNSTSATVVYDGDTVVLDIADVGEDNWNIQLFQEGLELVDTNTYRITFEAMSTVDREVNVKLIGATEYVETVALTSEMTVYTVDFVVAEDNENAKLDFELGGAMGGITVSAASVVTFDNVMFEELVDAAVVAETDQILNGDFMLNNKDSWGAWYGDEWSGVTTSSIDAANGMLEVEVVGLLDTHASYATQVYQEDLAFELGKTYKVSFDAMADDARQMNVNLGDALDSDPWFANFMATEVIDLTVDWQTFEIIFTMTAETTLDQGKLVFELGTIGGVAVDTIVRIDNVMVELLQQDELLMNGNFETSGWSTWMADWNSTAATVDYSNGYVELNITNVGEDNWNIQLFQADLALVDTNTYRATFEAMSTEDREINVKLIDDNGAEYVETIALTSTMTVYTVDFLVTADSVNAKLDFELGGATNGITVATGSAITMDNLMFEELVDAAVVADTNQIVNGTFDLPVEWGVWMADWNTTAATYGVADGAFVIDITNVGDENWNIQLFQAELPLVQGVTYTVVFDAMSTVARDINAKMIGSAEYAEMFSLTTEMVTYSYTFTYGEDDAANKLDFELGGVTAGVDGLILVSLPSVITFDNVQVFPNYNPQG